MELANALRQADGVTPLLSLSRQSELMQDAAPACELPVCELPVDTYRNAIGWAARLASAPVLVPLLARRLRRLNLDAAICAMPGPLDLVMAAALRLLGIPFAVVVHDADLHPGDTLRLQAVFQRRLVRQAGALVALSDHVALRLDQQGVVRGRPLLRAGLSSFAFGPVPAAPRLHAGKLRLLSFGRLLPYKGLDLLLGALQALGPDRMEVRIVGQGPETPVLDALRRLPGVTVENRWAPEGEVGALLAWSDAVILSHREASQSGIAAAAAAARRWIVATRVGGLAEQLAGDPLARLCDPTVEGLTLAIRSLFSDPPQDDPDRQDGFQQMATGLAQQIAAAFPVSNRLA